jgi:hypothetical protein
MIPQAFLKCSEGLLFPHRVYLLTADDGKPDSPLMVASGVDFNAAAGDVMDIPGFIGGSGVIKYPADFEFSLRRNERRILEYP